MDLVGNKNGKLRKTTGKQKESKEELQKDPVVEEVELHEVDMARQVAQRQN
jgi:hypothetical protein